MKKVFDVIWKRTEDKGSGKARWERVGIFIEDGDKKSIKLDLIPVGPSFDGWLIISERKEKEPF